VAAPEAVAGGGPVEDAVAARAAFDRDLAAVAAEDAVADTAAKGFVACGERGLHGCVFRCIDLLGRFLDRPRAGRLRSIRVAAARLVYGGFEVGEQMPEVFADVVGNDGFFVVPAGVRRRRYTLLGSRRAIPRGACRRSRERPPVCDPIAKA